LREIERAEGESKIERKIYVSMVEKESKTEIKIHI
jgi:hypothetical protein